MSLSLYYYDVFTMIKIGLITLAFLCLVGGVIGASYVFVLIYIVKKNLSVKGIFDHFNVKSLFKKKDKQDG